MGPWTLASPAGQWVLLPADAVGTPAVKTRCPKGKAYVRVEVGCQPARAPSPKTPTEFHAEKKMGSQTTCLRPLPLIILPSKEEKVGALLSPDNTCAFQKGWREKKQTSPPQKNQKISQGTHSPPPSTAAPGPGGPFWAAHQATDRRLRGF